MWMVRCPYCPGTQGRCATTASGRWVSECCACGRVVEERQVLAHPLFLLRAHDTPLPLVTPDLPFPPQRGPTEEEGEEDPFHPTGFITAFSTWSLEPAPVFVRSASSFAGHLAELERALVDTSAAAAAAAAADPSGGPLVSVDHLRAYLQIVDVSSILGLDRDIADHAFQLFRDCSSATCLRNRSVEALATAALVQAIREAQEPRTLQEISTASNLPQKEIGKYIKILGEALKLSQPINSNSIAVHMPRFCTLLQLNKSAQELAAHIGEVVVNKCFCTRRNPISISAAAIYLACQLEDKRKTQAEICKVTGLTEVTLRKVYKELLENWNDLLPPNYTPAVPPEKAFPMTSITSGRSSAPKVDTIDASYSNTYQDKDKHPEVIKPCKIADVMDLDCSVSAKEEVENSTSHDRSFSCFERDLNQAAFWQPQAPFGVPPLKPDAEKDHRCDRDGNMSESKSATSDCEHKADRDMNSYTARWMVQASAISSSKRYSHLWQFNVPPVVPGPSCVGTGTQGGDDADGSRDKDE